ncbi:MAG: hypothetical protein KTR15_11770 [Phycisphaeraceae bacterium]|nr:hypothetical protein [Phycisphaeraceae bacterium]
MPITHVALVGHCGFDSGSLARFASAVAPGAEVVRINDQRSLDGLPSRGLLLLVNRVLDGRFDVGGSGIELIKTLSSKTDSGPAMLVSNYEDAQQEAEAAGALPGFGKSQISDPAIKQRVTDAIAGLGTGADV